MPFRSNERKSKDGLPLSRGKTHPRGPHGVSPGEFSDGPTRNIRIELLVVTPIERAHRNHGVSVLTPRTAAELSLHPYAT